MIKVVALNASESSKIKRFGFMAGQIHVPDDFDRMGKEKIVKIFEGGARNFCWIPICYYG